MTPAAAVGIAQALEEEDEGERLEDELIAEGL